MNRIEPVREGTEDMAENENPRRWPESCPGQGRTSAAAEVQAAEADREFSALRPGGRTCRWTT